MNKRLAIILAFLIFVFACAEEGDEPIGAACEEKEDCESGLCFQAERWGESTGWSGGYCTKECSESCDRGAECVEIGVESYCMATCEQDSDCRSDYLCNPSISVCLPDCREGWDCGKLYFCDEDGYCSQSDSDGGSSEMGESCEDNDECLSSYCLPDSLGWADGMCSMESEDCPDDFSSILIDVYNLCLPQCEGSGECRSGYLCNPTYNVCLPDCRLGWDCGSTLECDDDGFCSSLSGKQMGESCSGNMDCNSGLCIVEQEMPGGLAWKDGICTQQCSGECPSGFKCLLTPDADMCLPVCTGAGGECRDGYICNPMADACMPDCRLGMACPAEMICNPTGFCM